MADLQWALENGDLDQIKVHIEKDKSVANAKLGNGRPPLCIAADYGHQEILEYLLNNGANVNVEDIHGITPLLSAVYEGHVQCVKFLLEKGADKSGKAPDGSTYLQCAETDDMKAVLK